MRACVWCMWCLAPFCELTFNKKKLVAGNYATMAPKNIHHSRRLNESTINKRSKKIRATQRIAMHKMNKVLAKNRNQSENKTTQMVKRHSTGETIERQDRICDKREQISIDINNSF